MVSPAFLKILSMPSMFSTGSLRWKSTSASKGFPSDKYIFLTNIPKFFQRCAMILLVICLMILTILYGRKISIYVMIILSTRATIRWLGQPTRTTSPGASDEAVSQYINHQYEDLD